MGTHTFSTIAGNAAAGGTGGSSGSITGTLLTDNMQEPNDDGGTTAIGMIESQSAVGTGAPQAETDNDVVWYVSGTQGLRIKIRSQGSATTSGQNTLALDSSICIAPSASGGQSTALTSSYQDMYVFNAGQTITALKITGTCIATSDDGSGLASGGGSLSVTAPLRTLAGSAITSTAGQTFDSGWITSNLTTTGVHLRVNQGHASASTSPEETIQYNYNCEVEFWARATGVADTKMKTVRFRYITAQTNNDALG